MTIQEILDEVRKRSGDETLDDDAILVKVNNEYDQTNLAILNLNEDYFFSEETLAVTSSLGPYYLPASFGKLRALLPPSPDDVPVNQVNPAAPGEYGWYFSGTELVSGDVKKKITFSETPAVTGDYRLRHVAYPTHLDKTTNTVPLWPAPFHEILILGALKRLFSIEDIYDKFPDLRAELTDLRTTLLAQVGGLNLGTNRQVRTYGDDLD